MVNASPEPFSNVAVSTAEDVATAGLLFLAFEYPWVAAGVALVLLALTFWLIAKARRLLRRLFPRPVPLATPAP